MKVFNHVTNWYVKNERMISSLSLVGGFIFNALTLKRVDFFWENFWVVVHLLVVAVCIILINRQENKRENSKDKEKVKITEEDARKHFILLTIIQFMYGGLLSTYLVFYFRSTTFSVTWPFLLLLAIAFIINERFKKHSIRLVYQISFLYLSIFSFLIFIVPVIVGAVGTWVFLLSGILSLVVMRMFISKLKKYGRERFEKNKFTQ